MDLLAYKINTGWNEHIRGGLRIISLARKMRENRQGLFVHVEGRIILSYIS